MPVTVIPFDSGQHQGISKNLLPSGTFALLQNGQLARDGQIRIRPGYTSLSSSTYGSGTFVGYDLYSYNDRLLALGDRLGKGFPTDLFEYTQGQGAATWRPTDPVVDTIRLPRATRVKDVGSPPEQEGGTQNMGCGASQGFVTLVYNDTATGSGYAHVFRPDTDQTFCFQTFPGTGDEPMQDLQAVGLDTGVVVLGLNQDEDEIAAKFFTYTSSETFGTAVTALIPNTGGDIAAYACCRVAGLDQFVIAAVKTDGTLFTRRFTNAGVLVVPSGGQYATPDISASNNTNCVAVEADSTANRITVITETGDATVIYVFNLSTGATLFGPITTAGTVGETVEKVTLTRESSTAVRILMDVTSDDTPSIYLETLNTTAGTFSASDILRGAQLASTAITHGGETVFAIRYGDANKHEGPNLLVSYAPTVTQDNRVTPLIGKDLEIADSTSVNLPTLCVDSSTGKYYWTNGIINTGEARPGSVNDSVDSLPLVTEFELGSVARRQAAQLGNLLYLSGGCPTFFDGRQMVETGFHARPKIISITPEESTDGALISGATYDYKFIWEALDSDRNITHSATSAITSIIMGAAEVQGTRSINPPSASLDGLSLVVRDSAGTIDVCTFGPTDLTENDVLSTINSELTVGISSNVDAGHNLVLTAGGTNTSIEILVGSANAILGLTPGVTLGGVPGEDPTSNTLKVSTPHSMRYNAGMTASGGSLRLKAYRTLATATLTPASVTAVNSIDPPAGSLTGLTLRIIDNVGGLNVVTFTGAATSSSVVLSEINAVLGSAATASMTGAALTITSSTAGEDSYVLIQRVGTANAILGFSITKDTVDHGTESFTKGENFQLCASSHIASNTRTGSYVELTDTLSDIELASQELIYTSILSDKSDHAPAPHDYVWAGKERLAVTGQPRQDRWSVSKLLNPFNSAAFAPEGEIGFSGRVAGNAEAVIVQGEDMAFFTRRKVWGVSGRGPERNGQGEFFAAGEITSRGLRREGWRSLCRCDEGVFFQLGDDKLYIMRDGGSPEWIGQPVRDTLTTNPVITAAVYCSGREVVAFSCQSEDGTTGSILIYDLRRQIWSQDEVGAVDSLAEFEGRIVYLQDGTVFLEDIEAGVGTFVPLTVTLGSFTGFGPMGWGDIQRIMLLGTYQGDCVIEAEISYNDGRTWTTLGNFSVTAANGYVANNPVELEFVPATQECSRFALRFSETFVGSDSKGTWLNALELHHSQNPGAKKLGSSYSR